jgi:hypothetical protein
MQSNWLKLFLPLLIPSLLSASWFLASTVDEGPLALQDWLPGSQSLRSQTYYFNIEWTTNSYTIHVHPIIPTPLGNSGQYTSISNLGRLSEVVQKLSMQWETVGASDKDEAYESLQNYWLRGNMMYISGENTQILVNITKEIQELLETMELNL